MGHNDAVEGDGRVQDVLHGDWDNEKKNAGEAATPTTIQTKYSVSNAVGVFSFPSP